jgi:hypothetical protein
MEFFYLKTDIITDSMSRNIESLKNKGEFVFIFFKQRIIYLKKKITFIILSVCLLEFLENHFVKKINFNLKIVLLLFFLNHF